MTLSINVELSKSGSKTCILQTAVIPNTKEAALRRLPVSHYKLQTTVLEIGIPKLQEAPEAPEGK